MNNVTRKYLIVYDMVDDRRRSKIHDCLMSYGERVQYSVFMVDTKPAKMLRLKEKIVSMIERSEDSVIVIDLGIAEGFSHARMEQIGKGSIDSRSGPYIV